MYQIFFNNVLIYTLYIFDITFLYKERNKKIRNQKNTESK